MIPVELGGVAKAYNPSTSEAEAVGSLQSEGSLGYIVSSKQPGLICESLSQNKDPTNRILL